MSGKPHESPATRNRNMKFVDIEKENEMEMMRIR